MMEFFVEVEKGHAVGQKLGEGELGAANPWAENARCMNRSRKKVEGILSPRLLFSPLLPSVWRSPPN
jgi:hypothetical protein